MSVLLFTCVFLSIIFSGYLFARCCGVKQDLFALGIGMILGPNLFTYFQFFLHFYLQIPFSLELLIVSIVLLLILISWLHFYLFGSTGISILYKYVQTLRRIAVSSSSQEKIASAAILLVILLSLVRNLYWPIVDWDALALYDFRALVLHQTGTFDDGVRRGYFLQYPPFTSLLHVIGYQLGFLQVKIWYTVLFTGFAMVFYSLVRWRQSKIIALLSTFFVVSSPLLFAHSAIAYTNLSYTVCIVASYLFLVRWIYKPTYTWLVIGALFAAFSTWSRLSEPFWFLSVILILFGIVKNKLFALHNLAVVSLAVLIIYFLKVPWHGFVEQYTQQNTVDVSAIPTGGRSLFSISLYYNFIPVLQFLSKAVLPLLYVHIPLIMISVIWYIQKRKWQQLLETGLFFIPLLMIFVGTLIFSTSFSQWQSIPDSARRMSMFLIPLAIFVITDACADIYRKRK